MSASPLVGIDPQREQLRPQSRALGRRCVTLRGRRLGALCSRVTLVPTLREGFEGRAVWEAHVQGPVDALQADAEPSAVVLAHEVGELQPSALADPPHRARHRSPRGRFELHEQPSTGDRIRYNHSTDGEGASWSTGWTMVNPEPNNEDHPGFDFSNGDLVMTGGNTSNSSHKVIVHFPEVSSTTDLTFVASAVTDAPDLYPDLVAAGNGTLHLAYEANQGDDLLHQRCAGTADCTDDANWTESTIYDTDQGSGNYVQHPQLALAGSKQLVLFEKAFSSHGSRVMMAERCGTGSWGAPELIRTPDGGENSLNENQRIGFGRPAIAVNQQDNVVHVLFIEQDDLDDVELWWYRRTYTPCE